MKHGMDIEAVMVYSVNYKRHNTHLKVCACVILACSLHAAQTNSKMQTCSASVKIKGN